MYSISISNQSAEGLVNAQTHVWNHMFYYLNSHALKCAIELGIPDAIQKHGKPMTVDELAISLSLHQNKANSLNRLMCLLCHSNFFSTLTLPSGEEAYNLTINSQLLLKDHPLTLAPLALLTLDPIFFESSYETPFHIAHGTSIWEYAACVPKFNKLFNDAMVSDTNFSASLLVINYEFKSFFEGIESLVDVGGGDGTMAKAIAELFPKLKCIVFDLPHVIKGSKGYGTNLNYVEGDMFEVVPPAQVALLKSVLHDWSDDHCIKILRRCKESIPGKDEGGKVIIIDMVVEINKDSVNDYSNSQLFFDIMLMNMTIGGKERTEEEWKWLFKSAGFDEYKIFTILGPRSVIEVYPSKIK
ncbi:hypothetical protein BVRB_4g095320 [Beta vulgaris subsp. vulgaris]|uniref:O-methyltransferase domain-containing protein n=1 Tax=Beta vulgaris subsp. vulgaris TaxID=3555 RepID=A0A0J8E4S7_BETVV|nr:hypothetical protein BVRB_4g095320 [Beta vulgaris subsp. vulgaris]